MGMLPRDQIQRGLLRARITDTAREVALVNFTADPGRLTESGTNNVAAHLANTLTKQSDDIESHRLELRQWLALRHDPGCWFFVTQPRIQVDYQCDNCRPRHHWRSTSDFFVLYEADAGYIETRSEKRIAWFVARHPGLYVPGKRRGEYHCPSAERWAAARGLGYRVITELALPALESRNLRDLDRFLTAPPPPEQLADAARRAVITAPGITLEALRREGIHIGTVLWLICHGGLYFDIARHALADPAHAPVYVDRIAAAAHTPVAPAATAIGNGAPRPVTFVRGARFVIADTAFEIEIVGASEVICRHLATGGLTRYPRQDLERFARDGIVRASLRPDEVAPDPRRALRAELYASVSAKALAIAQDRAILLGLVPGVARPSTAVNSPSARTLRRWRQRRREEEARTGDRLVGLFPRRRGGGRQLDPAVQALLVTAIEEMYLVPNPKGPDVIWRTVRERLEAMGMGPLAPVERTVARWMQTIEQRRVAEAQLGSRAKHALDPYRAVDPDDMPPTGDYPMQVVHIDSTVLDIETVCPFTGHPLGKVHLTAAVDGFTGRTLLDMLHYEAPSTATILRFLRRFVELYGWLPEAIMLDQGPEYHSVALQMFSTWTGMHIFYRPAEQPRFGSKVERYFEVVRRLMRTRSGQTTARKNPRLLSRRMDPTRFACWDVSSLGRLLDQARDWLNSLVLVQTGMSRDQCWDWGIAQHGVAPLKVWDAGDPAFLAWTLPLPKGRHVRVVDAAVGSISANYLTYLHDRLRRPELDRIEVAIRPDPDDLSHLFAFVKDEWVECRARELRHVRVVSAAEWKLWCEVYRQRATQARKGRLTGAGVAELVRSADEDQRLLLARLRAQAGTARPIQDERTDYTDSAPPRMAAAQPPPDDPAEDTADDPLGQAERDLESGYWRNENVI